MESVRLPEAKPPKLTINHFVIIMIIVIAIQGTYLGYVVGILTTLERRFGISSEKSGFLLSLYDIGHTAAILLIGYFGSKSHLPRITGIGVVLSAISMFLLTMPVILFGTVSHDSEMLYKNRELYEKEMKCDAYREVLEEQNCKSEREEHTVAYLILSFGQILAGVFAAPFNTIAYVYIDSNVYEKRKSPFLLGLLTSMYAFGPALGFALSAILTRVYTTLGTPPLHVNINDDHWIGAWWLGFLICGVLYLLCATPLFFFPRNYKYPGLTAEQHLLNKPSISPTQFGEHHSGWKRFKKSLQEFLLVLYDLIHNPVFVTIVIAWMFGSYLIGGYQTYLPKYIETQFGRSASMADFYSGLISIGSIAISTALGGWILTRWDISPRKAILCLLGSWMVIVITYLLGMLIGCQQPSIEGLHFIDTFQNWQFFDAYETESSCSAHCRCESVFRFDPVNFDGQNFFSPCHAGCSTYDIFSDIWSSCDCAMTGTVEKGLLHGRCNQVFGYVSIILIGLFVGNLFFMVTMMIVLRSVYDDQKVIALSLASFITNIFGFIPAPIIYGWVIDSTCILWNNRCPNDHGNCVIYDNSNFRFQFHLTSAFTQSLAVIFVLICYIVARKKKLPEEEDANYVNEYELQNLEH